METLKNLDPASRVVAATSLSVFSFVILFGFLFLAVGLMWMPMFFIGLALFVILQIGVLRIFIESKKGTPK